MPKLKLYDQPPSDAPPARPHSAESWVFALPVGERILFWDDAAQEYTWTKITLEHAIQLVQNTNRAIQDWAAETPPGLTPYRPPILREHQFEGWRGGDLLEARLAGSPAEGNHGVYLRACWLPAIWDQIQQGSTAHVSIGTLSTYVDSKGRDYSPVIQELSITETPRLKSLGTIQDYASLQLSEALVKGKNTMGYEEIMAMLQSIVDRMAALEEAIPAINQSVVDTHALIKAALEGLVEAEAAEAEAEVEMEMGEDMEDAEEADPKVQMSEEEVLAEILGVELAEKVQRLRQARGLAKSKSKGVRLNDAPAARPSSARRPAAQDRLAQARAKGLTGLAAIEAAFGK